MKRARDVSEAYLRIVNEIPGALNRVQEKMGTAEETVDDDNRIEAFLDLYKTQYEGLMTLLAAPVVVGFALCYGSKAKEFSPKPNGRVDLKAVELMEKWMVNPSNRLKEGLNRHVRNSYAHERYRILDGKRVEMWDEDHRGRRTWGPETWSLQQLEALCHRLNVTSSGVTLALALFGINYRKLITERGWVPQDIQTPPLRHEYLKRLTEQLAEYNSFDVTKCERDGKTFRIGLKTQYRGIDQDVEIMVGGDGWGRGYKKPVKYVQALVAEYALGIVQRLAPNIDDVEHFHVVVKNEQEGDIGELVISRDELSKLVGPRKGRIADDRRHAELDTLGDSQMWVKIEGRVIPSGGKKPRMDG